MSTIVQEAEQMAEEQLKRVRWALGLSGVISILFGIVVLVWPGISLYALVLLFGAYSLVNGVFGLAAALRLPKMPGRGWMIVSALAGIAVGVIVFFWTDMSALALLYVIGAYAITIGVFTIGSAFWLPLANNDKVLLVLTGFISIVFGVLMFAEPNDGALVLLALISAFALVRGIFELTVAIAGRRILAIKPARYGAARPQPTH
jgi:uncharacterized membrane protein HdeD (DUF308 family)